MYLFAGSLAIGNDSFILEIKKRCFDFLTNQVGGENIRYLQLMIPELFEEEFEQISFFYHARKARFGLGPFTVNCGMFLFRIFTKFHIYYSVKIKYDLMYNTCALFKLNFSLDKCRKVL